MAKLIFPSLLLLFSVSLILLLTPSPMAQSTHCNSDSPAVQIVYVEKPRDEQPEAYHIRILASVLGSEEAAREALLYSYKNAASAFSARLTPHQVAQLAKQEGVLQVVSKPYSSAAFRAFPPSLEEHQTLYGCLKNSIIPK